MMLGLGACATTPQGNDWDSDEFQQMRMEQARSAYNSGNPRLAAYLLLPLAERGHAEAQYTLGYLLYYGQGVDQNTEKAVDWLKRSAQAGNPKAVEALATLAGGATVKGGGTAPGLTAPTGSAQ